LSYRSLCLLAILFITISCAGKYNDPKKELSNNSKITKSPSKKQQKLAPVKENRKDYVSGEILVKFKEGTEDILDETSIEYVIERLQNYKEVKYSEPNYRRSIDNTETKKRTP